MNSLWLYRSILRLHRGLPSDLRFLGDSYVKDEWRKHRNADVKFVGPFVRAWQDYRVELIGQCGAVLDRNAGWNVVGKQLTEEMRERLTESQLKQLSLLEREATRNLRGQQ